MDFRVGSGFDVHAIGPGDGVALSGVFIPCGFSLIGHSDADVVLHAITDAILGAACLGDIGQHFPPSDPQWKGADSSVFLKHARKLALDIGFEINNLDVTVIGEAPKVSPHRDTMRQRLSDILDLDMTRISIKATTTEKLGFTGRGEGLAAMASVMLKTEA